MDPSRLYELFPQMDMSGDREAGLAEIKDLLKFDAIFHTLYTVMENVAESRETAVSSSKISSGWIRSACPF